MGMGGGEDLQRSTSDQRGEGGGVRLLEETRQKTPYTLNHTPSHLDLTPQMSTRGGLE